MKRIGQIRLEWALLGVIAVACALLSFLQYRWIGDLSRAELQRLRAGLNEQVGRVAHSFDDELRQSYNALIPDSTQIRSLGVEEAHRARYTQWVPSHDRGLFTRIGIAVPNQGALKLYGIDGDGQVAPMDWPEDWQSMRTAMTARIRDQVPGPPPTPVGSTLIQVPVFDFPGGRGGPGRDGPGRDMRDQHDQREQHDQPRHELEWMIFEFNQDYLRTKLLPNLVSEFINPGEALYDVSVNWAGANGPIVFSTRADGASVASGADSTAPIFPSLIGGPGRGRRGGPHDDDGQSRWVLAARHHAGSLEAAVSTAHTRNLVTSLILLGLLGGAAWTLNRFTARSRRLSEMQFLFAAGVSHDLRTPLTAIRGAAFNLVDGVVKEPSAVARYGKLILRNAEELTQMIENVLAYSASLEAKLQPETFAVGDLIEHASAAMAQEVEQAGCRIEVTVAPDLPPLAGDPMALELAFRNLIGNAARHAAEGKWIGVSAAPFGNGVEVRVCDRGPGIPETERAAIFEPFFRGEQSRLRRVPGTGLGLSLVKNTIDRFKGTVAVQNSPGGGTQFTLRLPPAPNPV
jgi:signal transduction histidine kinase